MSTSPQPRESDHHPDRPADVRVSEGVAATSGTYNAVAVFLALIVMAALAYGLVQTAIKASALFTG
ncbi:MFS transporter small subunit [Microbacterium sp. A93]|uniref:MFS transporter small subunit n=1 Tax=Microbacterium sp. A93 TaxID=3450716 RepID=UPI003F442DF4